MLDDNERNNEALKRNPYSFDIPYVDSSPSKPYTNLPCSDRIIPNNVISVQKVMYNKYSHLKRALIIILVLIVIFGATIGALFYINRPTPNKTLDAFCTNLIRGDYQTSYRQFSLAMQHLFSEQAFAHMFAHDKVTHCTYGPVDEAQGSAQTNLKILHRSRNTNAIQVLLTRDEKQIWKISDTRALPTHGIPKEAEIHHLTLSARQTFRDPTMVFTANKAGTENSIAVEPDERIVMFLVSTTHTLTGSSPCIAATLPEPKLPCYSVIYSLSLTGSAQQVQNPTEFITTGNGTIFLGLNIPSQTQFSGSFQVTLLTIPVGTATGLWQSPSDGFFTQRAPFAMSVQIYEQSASISSIDFFLLDEQGQNRGNICTVPYSGETLVSCQWRLTVNSGNRTPIASGPVKVGFSIHSQGLSIVNPDGIRTGEARYVQSETSLNYAGYAAQSLNQTVTHYQSATTRWIVPQVQCAPGETSDTGIWAGLMGVPSQSQLAQTGTESRCVSGTPRYDAWWEMYPAPSNRIENPVQPGDAITAQVIYQQGQFQLILDNESEHWHFATTQSGTDNDTITALCIVEAPFSLAKNSQYKLSDFGSVNVFCQANDQPIGITGPQNIVYHMSGVNPYASTSDLDQQGANFTVRWQSS